MVTVAKVAVKNTVYHFDKPFDYLVPDQLLGRNLIGCRVKVPFGTANTERIGMVMALSLIHIYGARVGQITYRLKGEVVATTDLIAASSLTPVLHEKSLWEKIVDYFKSLL